MCTNCIMLNGNDTSNGRDLREFFHKLERACKENIISRLIGSKQPGAANVISAAPISLDKVPRWPGVHWNRTLSESQESFFLDYLLDDLCWSIRNLHQWNVLGFVCIRCYKLRQSLRIWLAGLSPGTACKCLLAQPDLHKLYRCHLERASRRPAEVLMRGSLQDRWKPVTAALVWTTQRRWHCEWIMTTSSVGMSAVRVKSSCLTLADVCGRKSVKYKKNPEISSSERFKTCVLAA